MNCGIVDLSIQNTKPKLESWFRNKWKKYWGPFVRWLNTPPENDDLFLADFRRHYQKVFPCRHNWQYARRYTRSCPICDDHQVLTYCRYGAIRLEWKSIRV